MDTGEKRTSMRKIDTFFERDDITVVEKEIIQGRKEDEYVRLVYNTHTWKREYVVIPVNMTNGTYMTCRLDDALSQKADNVLRFRNMIYGNSYKDIRGILRHRGHGYIERRIYIIDRIEWKNTLILISIYEYDRRTSIRDQIIEGLREIKGIMNSNNVSHITLPSFGFEFNKFKYEDFKYLVMDIFKGTGFNITLYR